ncbi:MAG: ATP phosphoribosyltransferase, partial [Gammaproteobacteria bacterium]|nr:ATP phosphoribosyltransferase [Gammaproteobacteria bacterium]
KYVNSARQYYQERGIQAEIIKLYGAMELAPLVGLADEIVDLVETGNTLKANNLVAQELIAEISCRLIANAAALRVKHEVLSPLIDSLEQIVTGQSAA